MIIRPPRVFRLPRPDFSGGGGVTTGVAGGLDAQAPAATLSASGSVAATGEGPTYTPLILRNFDTGTIGTSAASEFTTGGSRGVYALDPVDGVTTCLECNAPNDEGEVTFKWGGYLGLPSYLYEGDELWVRWRTYWPIEGWREASTRLKFLRVHVLNSGGGNTGYNDMYIVGTTVDGQTPDSINWIYEGQQSWYFPSPSFKVLPLVWQTWEYYLKFHHDPTQAVVRMWLDGVKKMELSGAGNTYRTMNSATDYVNQILLFTYWNRGAFTYPINPQKCYVKDLTLASNASPPTTLDAEGHPFIGLAKVAA